MAANYDNSAWFYDRLARLVYGKALVKSQVYLLQYLKPNSTVLIVGGGTGWILEEITQMYPSGLTITYVEISSKMMLLSKKRNTGNNQITFINQAVEEVTLPFMAFDAIITPFLFDNFTGQTLKKVFDHLQNLLKPNGAWLNTDFQLTGKWWQNILLKTMFIFFKLICKVEASKLPEIESQFLQAGYRPIAGKTFFGDFITSQVFTKV